MNKKMLIGLLLLGLLAFAGCPKEEAPTGTAPGAGGAASGDGAAESGGE